MIVLCFLSALPKCKFLGNVSGLFRITGLNSNPHRLPVQDTSNVAQERVLSIGYVASCQRDIDLEPSPIRPSQPSNRFSLRSLGVFCANRITWSLKKNNHKLSKKIVF